jgi:hypothetical protein
VHVRAIGAFLTYARLGTRARAAPTDTKPAGRVETMFNGQARRGLLLNACAVDPVGGIASVSAIGAFVGAAVMAILSLLASPT